MEEREVVVGRVEIKEIGAVVKVRRRRVVVGGTR